MAVPGTKEEATDYLREFLAQHGTKSAAEIAALGEEELRNLQTALALEGLYVNTGDRAEAFIDGDMGETPSESLTWTGLQRAKTLLDVEGAPTPEEIVRETQSVIQQIEGTFGRDREHLVTRIQQNLNVLDAKDLADGGEDYNMGVQEVDTFMGNEVAMGLAGYYRKYNLIPSEGGRELLDRYLLEGREQFSTYLAANSVQPLAETPPGASDIRQSDLGGPSGFVDRGGSNPKMDNYAGVDLGRGDSPLYVTGIEFDGGWTFGKDTYSRTPFFGTQRNREHDGVDLYQLDGGANAEISMVGGPAIMVHRALHTGYGRTVVTMTDQQDLPPGVSIDVTPNNGMSDNPRISGEVSSISVFTINGHMNAYGEDVADMNTGDIMPDGTPIGLNGVSYGRNGQTFSSSPAHIHWETHIRLDMADGSKIVVPVDPQILLGEDLSGPAADLTDPAILQSILATSHTTRMSQTITQHSLAQLREWDAQLDAERANPTRVIERRRRRDQDGGGALPDAFSQVAQQDLAAITADPTLAKEYIDGFNALSSPSRQDIREVQRVLTAMGLYATQPHKYYADGYDGPVTQRGLRMAEELLNTENPQDSAFTASVIEDVNSLINKANLSPAEIMRLQQNLNYMDRIDDLDGGNDVDLNPDGVDAYMGENTANASLEAARKYGLQISSRGTIGRTLRRGGSDYDDVSSSADIEDLDLASVLSSSVLASSKVFDLQELLVAQGYDVGDPDGMIGTKTVNGSDGNSGIMQALKDDPTLLANMSQSALSAIYRHASRENREWLDNTWTQTFDGTQRADMLESAKIPSGGRFIEGITGTDVNTKTLLDFIGHYESRGEYNIAFDGTADGRSVPATEMTFAEITSWRSGHLAELRANGIWPSSALGKYQGVGDTIDGFLRANPDIDPNTDVFDEEMQDRFGIYLLHERGLAQFLSGEKSAEWFAQQIAKEWASLPAGTDNLSHYGGDGFHNDARVSWNDTVGLLEDFRDNYLAQQANPNATMDVALATTPG
ncbi:MAG: hypothetical protein JKY71_02270 [Alphaproteobacteria bacterium]|nr:hypothetical protein [Alphaproteobacteria bacterium]